jgi:transcriptional regulator with XRE-family HTH domain
MKPETTLQLNPKHETMFPLRNASERGGCMPRPNKDRQLLAERHLAQRIGIERDRRQWTYDGLASRMTARGCSIAASALYKIEKGEPPRKITVDELVALSLVFGLNVNDLLTDPSLPVPARVRQLIELHEQQLLTADVCEVLAYQLSNASKETWLELRRLVDGDPAADLQAQALIESLEGDRIRVAQEFKELAQSSLETTWSEMRAK